MSPYPGKSTRGKPVFCDASGFRPITVDASIPSVVFLLATPIRLNERFT